MLLTQFPRWGIFLKGVMIWLRSTGIATMVLADGLLGQMMEPIEFDFEPVEPAKLPAKDWALGNAEGRERRVIRSYDLRPGYLEKMTLKLAEKYKEIEEKETKFDRFRLKMRRFSWSHTELLPESRNRL